MTKDETIAMLQETIAVLRAERTSLVAALQTALEVLPPFLETHALSSTERSRLFRQRQRDEMQRKGDESATESVAPTIECYPVSLSGDVPSPVEEPREGSKTLSGDATPMQRRNVASVPLDMERAEADAASRGLNGDAFQSELLRFQDYWDSCGWKRKNGPVKDRNATWRSWLDSPFRNGTGKAKPDPQASIREWAAKHNAIEGRTV